jgi:molybdate transport system ATP-binding protein
MSLAISVRHRLGDFHLDATFESEGRLTAVFGASGSGKTTLINAIAGLLRPEFSRISVDGSVLDDTERGLHVPVHRRRIGYVFQESRLFPHLSVQQNLAFGRWFTDTEARYADMTQILDMLGLAPLLARMPHHLSGGERQRVALGRALLQSPRLLLMDEPLASLDKPRKLEIMPYIERLRDEMRIPIVYVSHAIAEVSRLATDIVAMSGGRVAQAGAADEVIQSLSFGDYEETYSGGTLLAMSVISYDKITDLTSLQSAAGVAKVPGFIAANGMLIRLRIDARDVMIATREPKGISALNIFSGRISEIGEVRGASVSVRMSCGGDIIVARITRHSCTALGLKKALPVFAVIKSVRVETPGPAPN